MLPLRELPLKPAVRAALGPSGKEYRLGECIVMVSRHDLNPGDGGRWHLSISHKHRMPTNDDVSEAHARLLPHVKDMMLRPGDLTSRFVVHMIEMLPEDPRGPRVTEDTIGVWEELTRDLQRRVN